MSKKQDTDQIADVTTVGGECIVHNNLSNLSQVVLCHDLCNTVLNRGAVDKNKLFLDCLAGQSNFDNHCNIIAKMHSKYKYIEYNNSHITISKQVGIDDIIMHIITVIIMSIVISIILLNITMNIYLSIISFLIVFVFFYHGDSGIKKQIFPYKTVIDLNKNEIYFVSFMKLFSCTKSVNDAKFSSYTYYTRSGSYSTHLDVKIDNKIFTINKYESQSKEGNVDAEIIAKSLNCALHGNKI